MNEKLKYSSIILFDDVFGNYTDDKEIASYIKNFGINKFIQKYYINLNDVKNLLKEAKSNELRTRDLSMSSSQITYDPSYQYSTKTRINQLRELIKSRNLEDKFFEIKIDKNVYFVQKIFAFRAVPNPVPELTLPKQNTSTNKINL